MIYPYQALAPDYTSCLTRMQFTRAEAINEAATRLVGFIDAGRYQDGCKATGVPQPWAAASFEREASSNFNLNPAQGWPLHSQSKWIPHNGPFADWSTAEIAAYEIDGLDKVGTPNWTWTRACYEGEIFNGMGYRAHGVHSPYLWSGSNVYAPPYGKFTGDGHFQWVQDTQLGIIPMMVRIIQLRPGLALADSLPMNVPAPIQAPALVPEGHHDAADLQAALNKLGADPQITVDGNYGRRTRAAVIQFQGRVALPQDGIAGPQTWAAIMQRLANLKG